METVEKIIKAMGETTKYVTIGRWNDIYVSDNYIFILSRKNKAITVMRKHI